MNSDAYRQLVRFVDGGGGKSVLAKKASEYFPKPGRPETHFEIIGVDEVADIDPPPQQPRGPLRVDRYRG